MDQHSNVVGFCLAKQLIFLCYQILAFQGVAKLHFPCWERGFNIGSEMVMFLKFFLSQHEHCIHLSPDVVIPSWLSCAVRFERNIGNSAMLGTLFQAQSLEYLLLPGCALCLHDAAIWQLYLGKLFNGVLLWQPRIIHSFYHAWSYHERDEEQQHNALMADSFLTLSGNFYFHYAYTKNGHQLLSFFRC